MPSSSIRLRVVPDVPSLPRAVIVIGKVFAVSLLYLTLSFDYNKQSPPNFRMLTMNRLMLYCLLGTGAWLYTTNAHAQDAPGPPNITDKKTETIIRKTPLDVIIFSDPNGNPIHSVRGGWPLTVADDFYDYLFKNRQNPVPPFIVRSVSATGTVAGHYVETHIQIEISTSAAQSVRIPLGFKEGILPNKDQTDQTPFRYIGAGSAELTVDPQERQYIAIVTPHTPQTTEPEESNKSEKPAISQPHTLSLLLWFPLAPNGGAEKRLSLSFPQSNSSLFLLEVPMSNIDAAVTRGFLFDQQENTEQQSTLLRIHGLRTDTEITWRKKADKIVDDRPVLFVEKAAIDVQLNAQTTGYDAVLPVSSTTGSFDQLQIRLPQGCTLDREMTDRYAVAGNYSVEEANEESVMTVRFPQKTAGPVSIHLRAAQQFEGNTPDFRRELAGFEVLGAERQTGTLTVSLFPSEMTPHWEQIRGIRRIEGDSTVSTGNARFEFISQPFRLGVQAASPRKRIYVKPVYRFHISRGTITLNTRLSYTVSGSKTDALYLRLPDAQWHCEFGSSSLVDTTGVKSDESGLLMIPLRNPAEGTFDIDFRAQRTIDVEDEQIQQLVLPIPQPQEVTWSEPAYITIESMSNIEVVPVDESSPASSVQRTHGLARLTRRMLPSWVRSDLNDLQQEPLFYRAELPDALFAANLVFHQQSINATMQTDVRLFEEFNQVTQTISYNAAYALVERVHFLLPKSLEASGDVQVRLGNRTLELRDSVSSIPENVPENWVRKSVQLPEPMFRFLLEFRYSPPPLTVTDDDTVPYSLSFIRPAEVPVTEHRIYFFTPPGYKVDLHNESRLQWEPSRELRRPALNITEAFRSVQSPARIALLVSAAERSVLGTTIVERAWLQTWLTGDIRVDRATYLLKSTNDSVTLGLPPDAMREHRVAVQVDRQPVQPNISPTGALTIPILPEQHNRLIEVSVDYRYSFKVSSMEVPVFLPSFTKDTFVQYQFWQIIIQQNKHILGSPAGWTLEYDWSWNGLFWRRIPSIRKSDIGFEPDPPDIEAVISGASQYVFSHLQPTPRVTLYIVNRSLIILCSSSIALFIGLVLIYIPQSRYAGSLFGLGTALLAVLFYQPPLVLLMLQAAMFGVFLALGTGYVYRIFHRQKQWIPPVFPLLDDVSRSYLTPVPGASQTVHEVVMDEESAGKEPSAVNSRHGVPVNSQS